LTIYAGSETIQERSPVQGGGTAGVTPSELNTPAIAFQGAAGDRLKMVIDNTTAGTPTVDGVIIANPIFCWRSRMKSSSGVSHASCRSSPASKEGRRPHSSGETLSPNSPSRRTQTSISNSGGTLSEVPHSSVQA